MSNRIVLVDMAHMGHIFMNVGATLTATVKLGGHPAVVDTTIASGVLKSIYRMCGKGMYPLGVCLEGGSKHRKEYFADQRVTTRKAEAAEKGKDGKAYKGTRTSRGGKLYEGLDMTVSVLHTGGVQLYRKLGWEADDMIASVVAKIKSTDTTTPIDIYTNDSDMLPLVDNQVSVWMRGTRTFAEEGQEMRKGYYQVTPSSWADYITIPSQFKGYYLPYNSVLLFKLVRGDSTDDVTGAVEGYGKKTFTQLTQKMEEEGVDFANVFRYGLNFDEDIRPVLLKYFNVEDVDYMKYIYGGISPQLSSVAAPKRFDDASLRQAANTLLINLPT